MMDFGNQLIAVFAALAVAAGALAGSSSGDGAGPSSGDGAGSFPGDRAESPSRIALVIDAAAARHGRDLVDPRLRAVDADVRLPRTVAEARIDVRYFAALGYRVVVAGPRAGAAADTSGAPAQRTADLSRALAAVGR
jgi:hypothetical protein